MRRRYNTPTLIKTILIVLFTGLSFSATGQYVIQSSDVTIDHSLDWIQSCSITNFNTVAYSNGNIEIPEQIDGTTIKGIDGTPPMISGGSFENKGITSLTLPGGIVQINNRAFANNAISTLTFSEGITHIGPYAFYNNNLTNVTLPSTLKNIFNYAFDGNSGLTSLILPKNGKAGFLGWKDNNGQSYAGGDAITDFTLTYTAQFVASYTLTDADVTLSNGVITACSNSVIGATLIIPDTLQGQEVTGIDANVFSALNIVDVTLPTPQTLGFTNWLSGTGTSYNGGVSITDFTTSYTAQFITSYKLVNTDVTISSGIISACSNVNNANIIIIPDTVQNQEVIAINANVFSGYSSISEIMLPTPEASNFINWLSGTGVSYASGSSIKDFNTSYTAQFNNNWYTLTDNDVDVTDGIIYNCSYTFATKRIVIPDTLDGQAVIGIKSLPFVQKGIVSLQLPKTIKSIEESAFYGNAITSIEMPDSVIEFGNAVFNKNAIVEVNGKLSDGIIYAKNSDGSDDSTTIVSYGGVSDIINFIPGTVKTITKYAFAGNGLTDVIIPSTITFIGAASFNWNPISQINGTTTNGIIFDRNTDGSDDSTTIVSYCGSAAILNFIPDVVTTIVEEAFSSSSLTSVTIPMNVDTIGGKAFLNNSISGVTFASNGALRYLGAEAFNDNSGLTLTLPTSNISHFGGWIDGSNNIYSAGATTNNMSTFYSAYLPYTLTDADLVMQEGNIISCSNTSGATAISIPDTLDGQAVIGVRAGAFEDQGIVVAYLPTHNSLNGFSGWLDFENNAISLKNGKYAINDFDITYIAKMPTYTLTSMDVVIQGNEIKSCSFSFGITSIIIPEILDGQIVKALGGHSFYEKGITAVQLPSTLEKIGGYSLTRNLFSSIVIPSNVSIIGSHAFYSSWTDMSPRLSQVTIDVGSKLTTIGTRAFGWCSSLTQIDLPEGIENIGDDAFYDCSLSSVNIPSSMVSIGKNAFCDQGVGNKSLTSVTIENNSNLEIIGAGAFANNLSLSGFTLPTSDIPSFMYWHCSGTGMDKGKYTEGELTKILTAQYIALYSYVLTNADVVVKDNIIQSYNNGNTLSSYIVIPDTLDGQAVKGIKENYVFGPFSQHSILGIELPKTLEYIPAYAFYGTDLIEIDLPQRVAYVGANAFIATNISEVTLPDCSTNGFVGWLKSTGDFVSLTDTGYVVTNLSVSYTATYKVLFKDYDGTLLKTDTVKHYASAVPPSDPTRAGYSFIGWDVDFSNIISGISVTAQYSQNGVNNYTVIFKDWDGTVLSTQTIAENDAATAPSDPTRTGYTFTGWNTDISKITGDLTVTAHYTALTNIVEIQENKVVKIYPNPSRNILVIELSGFKRTQDLEKGISIINCMGMTVFHSSCINTKQVIDISNLPKGFYFITVGTATQRIIKE